MALRGWARTVLIGPGGGSKTRLGSSWLSFLVFWSVGVVFLALLGSFWGRFGVLRGSFGCFFGISTHRFNPSTHQFVDSTHQLINPPIQLIKPSSHRFNPSTHRFNSSTRQPMALRHFLTRPGGLRAARLNPPPGPKGREQRRVRPWSEKMSKHNCRRIFANF